MVEDCCCCADGQLGPAGKASNEAAADITREALELVEEEEDEPNDEKALSKSPPAAVVFGGTDAGAGAEGNA